VCCNFKIKVFFIVVCFLIIGTSNSSRAQLNPGDIMFTGFNSDDPDGFSIVALAPIPIGTIIYFSDNNWSGTTFTLTEGVLTWTVTSVIPAGTVVIFDNTYPGPATVSSGLAVATPNFNLAAGGETLYCYLGAATIPTVFLTAISNNSFVSNTLSGTGLVIGVNAISFAGTPDIMVYNLVAPCTVSIAACAAQIANTTNWITEDGAGNQATNGIAPDFPSNVLLDPFISVLPIELIYFKIELNSKGMTQLNWATASEMNNDYFSIHWSTDGVNWIHLLDEIGAGNSTSLISYSVIDTRVIPERIYYRLMQTDFDGNQEIYSIISFEGKELENTEIQIFPNPSSGVFHVVAKSFTIDPIQIYDVQGREVTRLGRINKISENHYLVDISDLNTGIYMITNGEKVSRLEKN
jgi:hypothetical protein